MDKELMLSIVVITYNQENYVSKALDSILSQQTEHAYEIIVGDDASTDSTPQILKEYSHNYSDKLKVFLRDKNMGGKGANNLYDLLLKCDGKYIITLEGDDFWTDNKKIQKQIDFLEKNSDFIGVAHQCVVVNENSVPNGENYPECKDDVYTFKHLGSNIMPGQFTTLMYKNIYLSEKYDYSILNEALIPADRLIYFMLLSYGKVYCMHEKMSAYRHVTNGGSSYSSYVKWNYNEAKKWNEALVRYSRKLNNKTSQKYADLMLMKTIIGSRKRCNNNWKDIISGLQQEQFPLYRYIEYLYQIINRVIFHKTIWA